MAFGYSKGRRVWGSRKAPVRDGDQSSQETKGRGCPMQPLPSVPRATEKPLSGSWRRTVEKGKHMVCCFIPVVLIPLTHPQSLPFTASLPASIPTSPSNRSQTARGLGRPDAPSRQVAPGPVPAGCLGALLKLPLHLRGPDLLQKSLGWLCRHASLL